MSTWRERAATTCLILVMVLLTLAAVVLPLVFLLGSVLLSMNPRGLG